MCRNLTSCLRVKGYEKRIGFKKARRVTFVRRQFSTGYSFYLISSFTITVKPYPVTFFLTFIIFYFYTFTPNP